MPALSLFLSSSMCVSALSENIGFWLAGTPTVRCINIYLSIKRKIDGANVLRVGGMVGLREGGVKNCETAVFKCNG